MLKLKQTHYSDSFAALIMTAGVEQIPLNASKKYLKYEEPKTIKKTFPIDSGKFFQ